MSGTRYAVEVQPRIPERLSRLSELANDMMYSWERQIRILFVRLDAELWEACGHNPKVFLRRVSQQRLEEASQDRIFLEDYNRALSVYDTYLGEKIDADLARLLDPERELVAYFCAEYGFYESLPIYSGGLGILAGDYCKAASDMGIPFVAVGMLYRQGYFNQTIDGQGRQIAHYAPTNFDDIPVTAAQDADGKDVHIQVQLPGRTVTIKVWKLKAGRITVYLLDTDLPANSDQDRAITYQLYGGDINTRIQQEIILGIGGVRALRALGLKPTAWHINEGHASFQILERCRERVKTGLNFASALEMVAAGTVFTTHTPVPAGHDIFDHSLVHSYFAEYTRELGIDMDAFLALGATPGNLRGFNMTALALHGSRFHNGVSRIHGGVASHMESYVWPQIPAQENPIGYVTNGVHVPTFLAKEWVSTFDMRFGGGWRNELRNDGYWERIREIPDHSFWSLRQSLKSAMLEEVRHRVVRQFRRNGYSQAQINHIVSNLAPDETDALILGFARRFATYKRATLLFADLARLARLVNDPKRPVVLLFAGKAHPLDMPGQQLIKTIHEISQRPEFLGKILLVEGYDLALARRLVTGVDVWINTPQAPLEASGTSGQKAGINGVLNLSVLDGWWGEGYNGHNGWAIAPHGPEYDPAYRDQQEAHELMCILEEHVVPLYYQRNGHGYSEGWVKMSKASMQSLIPRFNSQRMVMDYVRDYYVSAIRQRALLMDNGGSGTQELAAWKKKVRTAWPQTSIRRIDEPAPVLMTGKQLKMRAAANLNGLDPRDVCVECLIGLDDEQGVFTAQKSFTFNAGRPLDSGETVFTLDMLPPLPGLQYYKIRMYPYHPSLSHRFETGLMTWV